jgi:UDP-glucose 4-epimerase
MDLPPRLEKVLILGHGGFIGSHLERSLRQHSPTLEIVGRSKPELDLTRKQDADRLAPLLDERTAVVMCSGVKKQLGDSLDTFSQNLAMVMNVCGLLAERTVKKFVFFSSAAVYGEDVEHSNISEKTPVCPTTYYGLVKYTSERLLWKTLGIHAQEGVPPLLVLRPALVYGPGDQAGGYGPSGFLQSLARGEKVTLWGDGEELREFIFIDDVTRIVRDLLIHDRSGVVNLASGTAYTFRNAAEIASRLLGRRAVLDSRPRTKAKVDHNFDSRAILRLIPALRFTTLEEGMGSTLRSESGTNGVRSV